MSAVVIAGNTSGTITLQAPAVSGSTVLNLPTVTGGTLLTNDSTGTYTLTGTTPRITGDFTNATPSNRFAFQTSTTNDATNLSAIPNGTSKYAGLTFFNSSDPDNASAFTVNTNAAGTAMNIASYQTGTGTYLPIRFLTSSTIRASIETNGDFYFNSGYGTYAVAYGCRAWVNFNGTGTVAIRASGNVSSITDNGTGRYTVNFTTAMPDTNYSMAGSGQLDTSNSTDNFSVVSYQRTSTASSTSSVAICTVVNGGSWTDCPIVNVNIFR